MAKIWNKHPLPQPTPHDLLSLFERIEVKDGADHVYPSSNYTILVFFRIKVELLLTTSLQYKHQFLIFQVSLELYGQHVHEYTDLYT